MSDHVINVDEFRHRPVHELAALLPDEQSVKSALNDLGSANVVAGQVRVLHGEEGARILDPTGAEHGFWPRFLRTLQRMGYDESILAVYDEGLRSGEALVTVPCDPENRYEIGRTLRGHGGHAIIYFGRGRAETLTGP